MYQFRIFFRTACFTTLLVTLISCTTNAQNPAITKKYSDKKIADLLIFHKNDKK